MLTVVAWFVAVWVITVIILITGLTSTSCRWSHKWSTWVDYPGYSTYQYRTCMVCKIRKSRDARA